MQIQYNYYPLGDAVFHKAALLSGPPGIGKTTTAVLACKVNIAPATPLHYQLDLFLSSLFLLSLSFPSLSLSVLQELGYSYTELNASATRSKKSLQQFVTDSLSSHSMDSFITGGKGHTSQPPPVHASWPLQFFLIIGRLNVIEILNFLFSIFAGVQRHHVLIMDEVDGMAGNEDRGGVAVRE